MSRRTGIVRDLRYLRHSASYDHPESPKRLEAIYAMLQTPEYQCKLIDIEPRYASPDEIKMFHHPSYVNLVASTAGMKNFSLDPDTETSAESYDTAKLAVGGLLNAIDSVISGDVDNAFALVRPPGHHAGAGEAAGFCIFNNIVIGAMHAMAKYKMKRILIVDWDLHHGNGTQAAFYEDARVLYFSTHQYPFYPGTGTIDEIGHGAGLGYTINFPLNPGAGNGEYLKIYRKILQPVALRFQPEIVMLSAGFDIYFNDPLGGMRVTPEGFAHMTRVLMDIADRCCGGRLVVVLEGGYDIKGLTESVKLVLNELRDETHVSEAGMDEMERGDKHRQDLIIQAVIEQIKPFWPVF